MRRLAILLRCTEGRAYTLVLGVALAVTITAVTVPAVLHHRPPAAARAIPFQDLSNADSAAPLTVEEAGYSSARPGIRQTPAGGLPVASLSGAVSQASFVRLSGQARLLHLNVDAAESRGGETAQLVICPILTETWRPMRDAPISASPPYDCTLAVPGLRLPDGGWTFDLGRFTDRAGSKGFAIVPPVTGNAAIPDFTIVFTP